MKVKVYKVYPRNNPDLYYYVDAPCKWVAKWCGAAIINNDYASFLTASDMSVERFKVEEA
jgi:hypothetical protein